MVGVGGAIITARFESVQMTVGTPLHTTGMVDGMTTVGLKEIATTCNLLKFALSGDLRVVR